MRVADPSAAVLTSCAGNTHGPFAPDLGGQSPYRPAVAPTASVTAAAGPAPASTTSHKAQTQDDYEGDVWLPRYLHLHYPPPPKSPGAAPGWVPEVALGFPAKCGEALIAAANQHGVPKGTALDLGCAVGGAAFRLAGEDGYASVCGVELSQRFVAAAKAIQAMAQEGSAEGGMSYELVAEGDQRHSAVAAVPASLAATAANVNFRVGDAMSLPSTADLGSPGGFDAVLLANLLCRLPKPIDLLRRLAGADGSGALVAPGGLLLITSPYSWKAEFTPRADWLGGGRPHGGGGGRGAPSDSSASGLKTELETLGFVRLEVKDMPLAICHHDRFFELIGSHATLWKRRVD